ncbi:GNAT family N-acetyltransferase [Pseudoalteromonas luteoviolacea]|uniref:GNAT family N-acetyltransferase n=1 Tax=Pseudoalteromonas luteoviolacea TaxID=43657 RepID=UPI001B39D2DC|nr:GNAT family N-acetyltransferase [Pseudoalteromonas luteoviolacea]MBQ4879111.1 GNAT family N-acetyltransferase [Pseudoalteromonas luteoviolacea]MBQ4908134.1 GNAT family N-acetyltransferase [Pseudoalteromonas luteoviolacea]
MKNNLSIREMSSSDLSAAKLIIEDNKMFPSELLNEMSTPFLSQTSEEKWFVVDSCDKQVIAIAYCSPERMTAGTWNLLLIAVLPSHQGHGVGRLLIEHIESALVQKQARIMLVETSGLPEYERTRKFYPQCGYTPVAVIPEYYGQGDDKIVFWKSLM